ncbi:MAG: hypothetical protein BWY77_01633 [bacterium ADurb.Bin431]|nr:MAG: hypothetical protein BWY77_01633 [bacterium ADurb.Bin431]
MVVVLFDLLSKKPAGVVLPDRAAHAAAAPGQLVPDQQAKLIAGAVDRGVLGIMAESDEVGSHFLDHAHVAEVEGIGEGAAIPGVLFVAMGAAQEQPPAVEIKRPFFREFEPAAAEAL